MIKYWRLIYSRTPEIRDESGSVKRGSIASLERVRLGGIEQTILLRGQDITLPVLLILHGGPGGSAMPLVHEFSNRLEERFVVVNWDQRGAGKSWATDIPPASMTVDQLVQDCRELVEDLCVRFDQPKIYLAGHSWGTQLGLLMVQRYPELFHAYIGIAQVVNVRRAESISWQFALQGARKSGDNAAADRLARLNPPGYDGQITDLLFQRECVTRYGGTFFDPTIDKKLFKKYFQSHEYSLGDLMKLKRGSNWSLERLWGQTLDWDILKHIPSLQMPVYFLHGRCDRVTPTELVQEYFDHLNAPLKKLIWFDRSGHCPLFEEPELFQHTLVEQVLTA